jgi:hypothetical protein
MRKPLTDHFYTEKGKTMTATKSRASQGADRADQDQGAQQQPEPEQEAQPEPKPAATFDLGAGRITFYRPSLTLPDGTVVDCPHDTWGHEKEPHAMKCLRKLATEHGVTLAKP